MIRVLIGKSYWLRGEFQNRAGTYTDPDTGTTTLKIYDYGMNILTTIAEASLTWISTGVYEYAYTIPSGTGYYIFEYSGTIDSVTNLNREILDRVFSIT